jgi:hypothetical protein
MKAVITLKYGWFCVVLAIVLTGCIKEQQPDFPLPSITFSNDYTYTAYVGMYRVYQDTTVLMPNRVIMTASCSSLAGVDETEVSLNGVKVHTKKEQFYEFNREIDTLYQPLQTPHTEDWLFKFTDKKGRVAMKEIRITVK